MPASARLRQSLEPLAAPLAGIGLLHVLVGFLVLSILPELKKQQSIKLKDHLAWMSPADFLMNKTIQEEATVVPPAQLLPTAAISPVMSKVEIPQTLTTTPAPTALTASVLAIAPATTPTPAKSDPGKSLLDVLQANRGQYQSSLETTLMGPGLLPLTINTVPPNMASPNTPQTAGIPKTSNLEPATVPILVPPVIPEKPATVTALPATAPAATPIPTSYGNQKEANKYITLSPILPPGKAPEKPRANKPVLNLLDIANLNANERAQEIEAGGAEMGSVEKALQIAILKEWTAPPAKSVPPSQRRATMEISILRDGTVSDASMKTASGSSLLDASIREAANRLKKIPVTLPSNFPKERYELRVNFQIE